MQRNHIILGLSVLAALIVGILIGRSTSPADEVDAGANTQPVVAAAPRGETGKTGHRFQALRDDDAPRPQEREDEGFYFKRVLLDTGGDLPEACFQFSAPLDDSGETNYADYARLIPDAGAAWSVNGTSLCASGLDFDKDYRATLRAGLPSAGTEALERAETVVVAFGDKPAYVGFAGDGVVLPRLEADGVGIETVNVEKIKIAVHRVSDRSLARKNIVAGDTASEGRYAYVWERDDGADVGVKIFERELETPGERNETATTVFALGAALDELKPGAYFIRLTDASPGADGARAASAWRWIVFTDMALTTFTGADGLDVFVRSLATAKPLQGVQLTLLAVNNDVLGEAVSNADGRARFDGALTNGDYQLNPHMVMAYGPQDDFAALDLSRAPLDLSDRDVGGRAAPARTDGFVYLDRGVYRPGEPVHISGLLRDKAGAAIASRPLSVIIRRPNYTQAHAQRIEALELGGFTFSYDLPNSAPRGVWRIEVKADGEDAIAASETFSVEDFVPQRLEVAIATDEKTPIRPGDARNVSVNARYLYGAPASALPVEAEARLRLDPNPFPDFSGFRFGPVNRRFDERFLKLPNATTDADGAGAITLNVDDAPKGYGAPMRADLVVGVVEPGGRPVRESARIPVRPDDYYLGLKLAGEKTGFGVEDTVEIEAVLIDWRGEVADGEVEWKLVEEDYWFDWYREDGRWKWRRSYRDILVAEGRDVTGRDAFARLVSQRLDQGSYRLTATKTGGGASTDIRFYVGWRSYAAGADSPDEAAITLQNESLTPGARARLYLNPPYEGEAIIAVATDRVLDIQRVGVGAEGREITIETKPEWGAGFYVLATIVTPRTPGERPVPRRAMAATYVPFDMSARKLEIAFDAPEVFRPRQKFELPIAINGAKRGAEIMMTVTAVDEGILRLTKFKSPDPAEHYYGKKRLGLEVRDDYGRILNANLGAPARFGGDQLGGEGLTVVPTKSVALFSGLLRVNADGKVVAPIDVPDFNGELRLMAVAWTAEKVGGAAAALTVRDPVPAELSLPRFVAPGDTATATLLIDNVDGAPGDYKVSIAGEGPIALASEATYALARGEKQTAAISFEAGAVGVGAISLSVAGPDGFSASRRYPIESRTPYFPVTQVRTEPLDAGATFSLDAGVLEPFAAGSAEASVSFSRIRGVEVGPLLDSLYRYPYGCTEQLTSSAMPLLFVDVLGGELSRDPERAVRPRVQAAVNKLLNRQGPDGAFGLWRVGDRYANAWLGPYVADFLYRAKAEGYGVSQEALDRAYESLQQIARLDRWYPASYQSRADETENSNDKTEYLRRRAAAYAMYVLARAGRADLSDLRYFHDALMDDTPSPLARAHLAAALSMMGDRARSNNAFEKAGEAIGWNNTGDYYQTSLRDAAGAVALAAEAGQADDVEALTDQFLGLMKEPTRMHTQEKAYVLLAAQALLRAGGAVELSRNGERLADLAPAPSFTPTLDALEAGVAFRNEGDGRIYRTLTLSGSPLSAPLPTNQGLELTKRVATRDGRPADLSSARQNDRFVIVLSGRAQDNRLHPAIVADLLPAGFEIETILTAKDGRGGEANGPFKWIGEIARPRVAEARDDRFVAAVDIRGGNRFTLAYVVRAVTPGAFVMPGAVLEDMYRPGVFARTAQQQVTIGAPE
ncbi:MAG: alpha-2-macroglobulin [Pseudomonadota bacterium]